MLLLGRQSGLVVLQVDMAERLLYIFVLITMMSN
jgi:hypothetical protein